uniref:Envelope fusion glycoprotein n=1 Tax=Adineta vaga TaxID=104782 RepID=A0A1W6BQY2_ADIVA|nr:envelope fusion glycoprotein [Adineta vaga]
MQLKLIWFTVFALTIQSIATLNITLPKQDILHKSSGLIMNYIAEYKPADNIISITVSIPMFKDMCYLVPIKAMKKIPQCMIKSDVDNKMTEQKSKRSITKERYKQQRRKRFLPTLIPIAMGTATTILSAINLLQGANLQQQVKTTFDTINIMRDTMDVHASQIFQLTAGQIRSTEELYHTQMALNNTIKIVNEHSDGIRQNQMAIKALSEILRIFQNKLTTFMHNVETHFIHDSVEDILANKLNLRFIHHRDLSRVIEIVMRETNIVVDKDNDELPMFELINRLLVQQRVEFISAKDPYRSNQERIGNLLFISFFAATDKNQHTFSTYKLIPIPFNHENQRAKLAQVPSMVSISMEKIEMIQWTKEEAATCHFKSTSSCRETPPIKKNWQQSCLFEIITDSKLTNCRIEAELEPIFIQRIGNQWAVSTKNSTKCHQVAHKDQEEVVITTNTEIILPPIALVPTNNLTSLSCDHFFLPKLTTNISQQISIIEEKTMTEAKSDVIDLDTHIKNTTKWEKIPYISSDNLNMFEYLMKTPLAKTTKYVQTTWYESLIPKIIVILVFAVVALSIICTYLMWTIKKKKLIKIINMPAT